MKKYFLIAAFVLLIISLSGCSFSLLEKNNAPAPTKPISDSETGKIEEPDAGQSDLEIAEETLVKFFDLLYQSEFDQALGLFEPDGGESFWEGLEPFSLPEERGNRARALGNYCQATGTCLEAKVIDAEETGNGEYNLLVQFQNPDGSIFVFGPCCGATEEEMPPKDKFNFQVKKINNVFKVTTAPLYRP